MNKILVMYLAHPIGTGPDRDMNIRSAKMWLRALIDILPDCAISIPWLPYVEVLAEDTHRDRGIRDDKIMIARGHDGGIMTGGRMSPGMLIERDHFSVLRRPVVDLTAAPLPGILTYENYRETQTDLFRTIVQEAYRRAFA